MLNQFTLKKEDTVEENCHVERGTDLWLCEITLDQANKKEVLKGVFSPVFWEPFPQDPFERGGIVELWAGGMIGAPVRTSVWKVHADKLNCVVDHTPHPRKITCKL